MELDKLFPLMGNTYPQRYGLQGGIVNTHTHPRGTIASGDGRADLFIPHYQEVYGDVIAIGNTKVAITTSALALTQKAEWQALSKYTRIHVAGLMTEHTDPNDIVTGYDRPDGEEAWIAMKMFIRAISNSGGYDVDDVSKVIPCIKAMNRTAWKHKKKAMVLKIHCERKYTPTGRIIPFMERERVSILRDVEYILQEVPEAEIEICHVSDGDTIEAIRYFRSKGYNVSGEISPHYTLYTCDDLFEGPGGGTALDVHKFCLPIFKSSRDRRIIWDAMVSGEPYWHFGNDEACHNNDPTQDGGVKINNRGIVVGGQTQVPEAIISYVIEKFVEMDRSRYLQGFLVDNARRLYGLPFRNSVTNFKFGEWKVPHELGMDFPKEDQRVRCVVAMGGEARKYQVD